MTTKQNDTVSHDLEQDVDALIGGRRERLRFTVNSDLITQYAPGIHPGPEPRKQLEGVFDADGFPILFFLDGEMTRLDAAYRDPAYAPGEPEWKRVEVTRALLDEHFRGRTDVKIQRYDVAQSVDGSFKLLVEVFDPRQGKSYFFAGDPVQNDIGEGFLSKLRTFRPRGALDGETLHALVGSSHLNDARHGAIEVVTLRHHGALQHYHWVPKGVDKERPEEAYWRAFSLPVNASNLVDLVPGKSIDGHGVYAVTELRGKQSLAFTCLIDVDGYLVGAHVALGLPDGAVQSLASAIGDAEGHTDLYLGGQGIWCHKAERVKLGALKVPSPIRLTRHDELIGVSSLLAQADEGGVTLLAIHGAGDLSRLVRPLEISEVEGYCGSEEYLSPVPIHKDLKEVCLVRGREGVGETLAVVDKNDALLRFEHSESGWNEKNVPLPARVGVNEIKGYTTQITIERSLARPLFSERDDKLVPPTFNLSCDETVELQINGRHERVGPEAPASVSPDPQGKITIVSQVESPAAPGLSLTSAYFPETLAISPSRKLEKRMHSFKKKEDMSRDLVDADGKSLITRPQNLDAAFKATGDLQGINNVFRVSAGLTAEFAPDIDPYETWGISIEGGVATYHRGDAAVSAMGSGPNKDWFLKALAAAAADALRWIGDRLHDAAQVVVRAVGKVWHFAVMIGEQAYRFVIDSATKLFEAFKVVLTNVLGLNFDAIFKWIGFLFGWKDVVTTYKVFSNVAYQSFAHAEAELLTLETRLPGYLDTVETAINDALSKVEANLDLKTLNLLSDKENGRQHETDRTRAVGAQAKKTAAGNFGAHQMQNSGALVVDRETGEVSMPGLFSDPEKLRERLLASLPPDALSAAGGHEANILKWFEGVWASIKNLCITLSKVVTGQSITVKEVIDQIKSFVTLMIAAVREVLVLGFRFVRGLVSAFKVILFDELNTIPFLSGLFRRIVSLGGGDEPRFGLNAVNVSILLMAIPATFTFKLLTGRAPFTEGGRSVVNGLDTMSHDKLFAAFQNGGLGRRTYTDYRSVSQLMSTGLTALQDAASAVAAVAGETIPALLSLPLDMTRVACSIPIGPFGIGKLGGWVANWIAVAASVFGVASPGPSGKVTSVLKIILNVVFKGAVPLIGFFMGIAQIADSRFKEPDRRFEHLAHNTWVLFDSIVSGVGKILISVAALDPEAESKAAILAGGSITVAVASGLELGRVAVITMTDLTPFDALT